MADQDTPHKDRTVSRAAHTAGAHSTRKPTLQEYRQRLVQEMTNRSVPLPLQDFLEEFLPVPLNQKPKRTTATLRKKFSVLEKAHSDGVKEAVVSETFTKVVNDSKLAPGLKLVLSQHRPDPDDSTLQKIDGAFFPRGSAPTDGTPHWAEQIVSVEFKKHGTENDPFEDNEEKAMDTEAESRKKVRSQIIGYAEKVFQQRPRTHLFMLVVIGGHFRVLRWDRSGVVVTPLTDYVLHPELLYEFLWRIGRASMAQLGLDPTASLIKRGSADYKLMDELSQPVATDLVAERWKTIADGDEDNVFAYVREMFRKSLEGDCPRWRLSVPQADGSMREFLVGKPTFTAPGLIGRATQGYVAIDPLAEEPKKMFVWLKDAWRTFYNFVEAEGVVLQQLKDASVSGIPTLVCHGDLPLQATVTPDIWEKNRKAAEEKRKAAARTPTAISDDGSCPRGAATLVPHPAEVVALVGPSSGVKRRRDEDEDRQKMPPPPCGVQGSEVDDSEEKCPLRRHIHYRIVVEEVGRPLETFEDGHHLVSVIHDCIKAHRQAATVGILHRDISGGNILIYPRVVEDKEKRRKTVALKGILTDWELSKDVKVKGRPRRARQPERTGTWQYMSVALINEPTKAVEIPDELEAFFNVMLYYAVRYLHSDCEDVPHYIEFYFEAYQIVSGRYQCGNLKNFTIASGELYTSESTLSKLRFGTAIDHVLLTILQWLKAHHTVREYARAPKVESNTAPRRSTDCDDSDRRPALSDDEDDDDDDEDMDESLATAPLTAPSEQTLKSAQKVAQHDSTLKFLRWCINGDPRAKLPDGLRWPKDDKVPDRYPVGSKKQLRTAPTGLIDSENDSSKRRKTNSGAAVLVPVQHAARTPSHSCLSSMAVYDSGYASGSKLHPSSCPQ
ncbi:hypothetical protein GY45DRAFT_1337846 [Cubamyces sp. BRFM 1775]|nr:hypothetical protein GY45DRAFT_1337846 [Cubamyces sp. BRFM 1775]